MKLNSFTELECWKESRSLRNDISKLANTFPVEEKYDLISQVKRSSRSVTANIAEGHGRFHYQENIQFCRQARGSLTETLDHLITAFDEGYIDQTTLEQLQLKLEKCLKLLNGFINYLKRAKNDQV